MSGGEWCLHHLPHGEAQGSPAQVCIVPISLLWTVYRSNLSGMYESLLKRVTSEEIMSRKVKRSSSPGLPGENLFNCLPKCLCGRTPAPSSRVQAKADVNLKKKMEITAGWNSSKVKTLIQVSLAPWQWFGDAVSFDYNSDGYLTWIFQWHFHAM